MSLSTANNQALAHRAQPAITDHRQSRGIHEILSSCARRIFAGGLHGGAAARAGADLQRKRQDPAPDLRTASPEPRTLLPGKEHLRHSRCRNEAPRLRRHHRCRRQVDESPRAVRIRQGAGRRRRLWRRRRDAERPRPHADDPRRHGWPAAGREDRASLRLHRRATPHGAAKSPASCTPAATTST